MPLLNYTTKIDADKTAQEIAKCLSLHGAKAVLTEYDSETNQVSAISFKISLKGNDITFRLPCDWRPVLEVLKRQREKNGRIEANQLSAVRVSWRIVKDWVEAQMALVETQMASTTEVFLPYAIGRDGKTIFQKITENPQLLLGDGN